jgi:hypothetical protein
LREREREATSFRFVETSSDSLSGGRKNFKAPLSKGACCTRQGKSFAPHTVAALLASRDRHIPFLDFTFFIYRQAIKLCGISAAGQKRRCFERAKAACCVCLWRIHRRPRSHGKENVREKFAFHRLLHQNSRGKHESGIFLKKFALEVVYMLKETQADPR